jgi:tRNA dimethylallyltransferase
MSKAILIAGPTGIGKSSLALKLAAELNGEIINADSVQVYSDLQILSARPTDFDTRIVPHHLYGTVDGSASFGLHNWLSQASQVAKQIINRKKIPIIVGGTGLYLTALDKGYVPVQRIRKQEITDPIRSKISESNHWIRRGSFFLSPGSRESGVRYLPVDKLVRVVLNCGRDDLNRSIDRNFEEMIKAGAVDEVARLMNRRLSAELPVMKALGVRELAAYLSGSVSLEQAITLGQRNSRRFARRQLTWFLNQMREWKFVFPENAAQEVLSILFQK